jgi:hypothetical protein
MEATSTQQEDIMHVLHLPPHHLWRAALLTVVLAFAMLLAGSALVELDLQLFSGGQAVPDAAPVPLQGEGSAPRWVTDPLAPPTFAPKP